MKDILNKRFGRLVVLWESHQYFGRRKRFFYRCICDCGRLKTIDRDSILSKTTQSCGCLQKERARKANTTHGKRSLRVYNIWNDMVSRCKNKNSIEYKRYGSKGINVCLDWNKFEKFYKDMGDPPTSKHSIDRIDNDRGYLKENCRWATSKEQARNRKSTILHTINGQTKPLIEWCEIHNKSHATVYMRIRRGWSKDRALKEPVRHGL